MSEMEEEIRKREKEFSNWQQECTNAAKRTKRPPDYFIRAKIYDRNMKSGTYKVNDVPLDKGMAMLIDFTETKIQLNGGSKNNGNKKEGAIKIEVQVPKVEKKREGYHELL